MPHCPVCSSEIRYYIVHDAYPSNASQFLLDSRTLMPVEPADYSTFYYIWNPAKPFSIPRSQLHTCCLCHKPNKIAYQFSCCNAEYCLDCSRKETIHQYLICSICYFCPNVVYVYLHHPKRAYLTITNTPTPRLLPTRLFQTQQQASAQIEFPIQRFSPATIIPPSSTIIETYSPQINVMALLQQPPFTVVPRYQATQIDNPFPELPLMSIPAITYSPPIPSSLQQEWFPVYSKCPIDLIADLSPLDFLASIQSLNYDKLPTYECDICYSPRTTIVRLQCNHTLCATCYNKMKSEQIKKINQTNTPTISYQSGIFCPFCRGPSLYYHFSYTYNERNLRLCHWINPINDATLAVQPRSLSYIDESTQTEWLDSEDRILFQRGEKC